jgi:hypothetical protein
LPDNSVWSRLQYEDDPGLSTDVASSGSIFASIGLHFMELPMIVAYPAGCHDFSCGVKYTAALESDVAADFLGNRILELPQVHHFPRKYVARLCEMPGGGVKDITNEFKYFGGIPVVSKLQNLRI